MILKKFALSTILTLLLLTVSGFAATAPCSNSKYGSTYAAGIPGGQVRLGINETNGRLIVGFLMGDQAIGFTGGDSMVYGPHKLVASSKTFGGAKAEMKSLQIYILAVTDKEAIFQIDLGGKNQTLIAEVQTLASEKATGAAAGTSKVTKEQTIFREDESGGLACYKSLLGQPSVYDYSKPFCVNMNTEQSWWDCLSCCAFSTYSSQSTVCNPQV